MSALEHDTDVLAFRMLERVFVVFYVARLGGVDCVVATHCAVVAWEPFRAALAEDDVAGDYVLFCCVMISLLCCFVVRFVLMCLCVEGCFLNLSRQVYDSREKEVMHVRTSALLSTQSLSCTVLCRVGSSLGFVRGISYGDAGVGDGWRRKAQC